MIVALCNVSSFAWSVSDTNSQYFQRSDVLAAFERSEIVEQQQLTENVVSFRQQGKLALSSRNSVLRTDRGFELRWLNALNSNTRAKNNSSFSHFGKLIAYWFRKFLIWNSPNYV